MCWYVYQHKRPCFSKETMQNTLFVILSGLRADGSRHNIAECLQNGKWVPCYTIGYIESPESRILFKSAGCSRLSLQHKIQVFLQRLEILLMRHLILQDLNGHVIGDRILHPNLLNEGVIDRNGALFAVDVLF